ncbi:MAG: hypothetical protein GX589_09910 [Deltaproteobacteria bacterium]|jgi:tetratricopeptide (TPR) repeat protein|nr:hypothetical protein [Deltaproteobacteria bacterium]
MDKFTEKELRWIESVSDALTTLATSGSVQAISKLEEIFISTKSQYGPTHEHTTAVLNALGAAHISGKKWDEARRTFKEARQNADLCTEQTVSELLSAGAFSGLAAVLMQEQEYEQALLHFEKAASLAARIPVAAELGTAPFSMAEAEVYFSQKKYKQAAAAFMKTANTLNPLIRFKEDYTHVAYIQARAAFASYLAEDLDHAKETLETILYLRETLDLQQGPVFVACINLLAAVFRKQGNVGSAEIHANWGLESCLESYDMGSSIAISALNYAANHYITVKDWSKAVEVLNDAASYVDKVMEAEEALWIFNNLLNMAVLQNDAKSEERYQTMLNNVYSNQYTGDYLKDKAMVEGGDQGAAAKRHQSFYSDLAKTQAKYDTDIHPQVDAELGGSNVKVCHGALEAMNRAYLLRLLDEKAPLEIISAACKKNSESQAAASPISIDAQEQEVQWAQELAGLLEQEKHQEALSFLTDRMNQVAEAEGRYSPNFQLLYEAAAAIYDAQNKNEEARLARIRAGLVKNHVAVHSWN